MVKDLRSTAKEACSSLVSHFSDPIHHDVSVDVAAPYFDPSLGGPMPDLSPVCGFWHRQLLQAAAAAQVESTLDAARELLCCYESAIHPCFKRGASSADEMGGRGISGQGEVPFGAMVAICRNYELLLAHLMRAGSSEKSCVDEVVIGNGNGWAHLNVNENSTIDSKEGVEKDAAKILTVIAGDIFQWSTRLPKKDKSALWQVQNVLQPFLLRLIEHSVALMNSDHQGEGKPESKARSREALAVATVAAVPFVGDGKLKSGVFSIGSLLDWTLKSTLGVVHEDAPTENRPLSLACTIQKIPFHIISQESNSDATHLHTLPTSVMESNFMTRPVIDWNVSSARSDAPWSNGVTGTASGVAMSLLRKLEQASCCYESLPMEEVESSSLPVLLSRISRNIGVDSLAMTLRAHFFGRLSYSCDSNDEAVQPRAGRVFMPMIQRLGSNIDDRSGAVARSAEKPHIEVPMRVSAAAILLCATLPRPCDKFRRQDRALSDAVPIALTLLDDAKSIHQAIGASVLVSIIEAASITKEDPVPSFVEGYGSLISASLESAIQMCGRAAPTVLTSICLAQSKWIQYLEQFCFNPNAGKSSSEVRSMARKAVADVLVSINKQAQMGGRDGNDERIAGALVAGVNPLLTQLATFPEAASVEVARIGLSALLPSVGWRGLSSGARTVQLAALTSLISLMDGAYPVMPHHGGKIMTEVFLLLDRADKDARYLSRNGATRSKGRDYNHERVSTDAVRKVAVCAAAVALAICGDSAKAVLDHVESTQKSRKPLLDRCLEIRAASERLRRVH